MKALFFVDKKIKDDFRKFSNLCLNLINLFVYPNLKSKIWQILIITIITYEE